MEACFLWLAQLDFLYSFGDISPIVVWAFLHQLKLRKCPTDMPTDQSGGGKSSVEFFFPQDT